MRRKHDIILDYPADFFDGLPKLSASTIKRTNKLRIPKAKRLEAEKQYLEEQKELLEERLDKVKIQQAALAQATSVPVAFG